MVLRELDSVVLTEDLPDTALMAGDLGTIVLVHQGGIGYEVEFVALDGETVAVTSVFSAQVRPVKRGEIAHVRPLRESHPVAA